MPRTRPGPHIRSPRCSRRAGISAWCDFSRDTYETRYQAYELTGGERDALRYVESLSGDVGVLTSGYLGTLVPAFTGKPVWVGHPSWTPDYPTRVRRAEDLFEGRTGRGDALGLLEESRANVVLSDCAGRADLSRILGARVLSERGFGCARVYRLSRTMPPG